MVLWVTVVWLTYVFSSEVCISVNNRLFYTDEEVGSVHGMKALVKREDFKQLNVGFCLDEGLASPSDVFTVFYAERSGWCTLCVWCVCVGVCGGGVCNMCVLFIFDVYI